MQVFSYENLEFLLEEGIDAYIPDNFYKAEKKEKPGSSGNLSLNTMKKKTVIIVLLHLRFSLQ